MKRLVVGVFVSALAMFGMAPAASADTVSESGVVKVYQVKKLKAGKAIDWDAPAPAPGGGFTAQRIDWD